MDQTQAANSLPSMLECMMLIRAYEEKLAELHVKTGMAGTCTSVGQEASAVGVVRALSNEDRILTNHRSAGHLLARGGDAGRMMAEVMGKATGYCKGKSGSLHISAKDLGLLLTSTIVGGGLSLATGVGLSMNMTGQKGLVACFFGDGAACEGIFHESINLAAVWKLPILYVCENNQWQAYVHRKETMLGDRVSAHAKAYQVEGTTVDGNDVEAVHAAAREAAAYIRETGKPYLLETTTYRLRGHFEPDDQSYVDQQELAAWRAKDPIATLQSRLLDRKWITPAELEQMQQRIENVIDEAVDFANTSPYPHLSELTTEVYA